MSKEIIPQEVLVTKILLIRGHKVMLDRDLAQLYGVSAKVLNQAVKRKRKRFPPDFMFRLSKEEMQNWKSRFVTSKYVFKPEAVGRSRSQSVTLKRGRNIKYFPYAFTENGISMLSTVLNSERAITINIQIMRTFNRLKELVASHKELAARLDELEKKYDGQFKIVFSAIRALVVVPAKPKKQIGFTA